MFGSLEGKCRSIRYILGVWVCLYILHLYLYTYLYIYSVYNWALLVFPVHFIVHWCFGDQCFGLGSFTFFQIPYTRDLYPFKPLVKTEKNIQMFLPWMQRRTSSQERIRWSPRPEPSFLFSPCSTGAGGMLEVFVSMWYGCKYTYINIYCMCIFMNA